MRDIFRQNILMQQAGSPQAGHISGNFPHNILIGTQFENLWKFSEI